MNLLYILAAAFGIGLLIFIHEFGHFLVARWIGARVEVFSLGFGPRLFGFQKGDTDYRFSLIPVGGYVQVVGQDPSDHRFAPEERLYTKSVGARLAFYSGGVVMNLLFALVAFPIVFAVGVDFEAPRVGAIVPGGPGWHAGLQPGDRVNKLDGKVMYSFNNLEVEVALADESVRLEVERGGEIFETIARPEYSTERGIRVLGVGLGTANIHHELIVEPGSAAEKAGLASGDWLVSVDGADAIGNKLGTALSGLGHVIPADTEVPSTAITVLRDGVEKTVEYKPELDELSDALGWRIGVYPALRKVAGIRGDIAPRTGLLKNDIILKIGDALFDGDPDKLGGGFMDLHPRSITVLRNDSEVVLPVNDFTDKDYERVGDDIGLAADLSEARVRPYSNSPAALAGLGQGSRVVRVGGVAVETWQEFADQVKQAGNKPLAVTALPLGGNAVTEHTIHPSRTIVKLGFDITKRGVLEPYQKDSFGEALSAGAVASGDLIKQLYVTLKKLFTGEVAAKNLGGIITISRVSYRGAQRGGAWFFYFLALLSLNLAFINILPIPVLDGGHVMFLIIEKIKGGPVSQKVFGYSQLIGVVFVLALLLFVTYNDIVRLLT